jgi:hypothetical protein
VRSPRHLLLLAFVAIPLTLVVFYLVQLFRGDSGDTGLLDLSVLYPGLLLFTTIGAILYTVAVEALERVRPVTPVIAVALTPLLVLPWLAFPVRALLFWPPFV